ncbi:hypothetical protein AU106_gp149 [Sinorhizobium phage phiM9]|uniref:Uncharacterized protein n=1 Tax=Sinorhizobium phage phiM9 TaxID=1636182 RepID=A0A0F6R5Z3_9CAUD|nr:hypothetical protein AU106_gp149 [Sinorhizobium phage phiM9]AKE44780.1 hypothetical protein Sm_phiM9_152 [Sinorhizobium phage phiM9]
MKERITLENNVLDIPELNKFRIGDEIEVQDYMYPEWNGTKGMIIGIELRRVYGSMVFAPSITILHDGYVTDEFTPGDLTLIKRHGETND